MKHQGDRVRNIFACYCHVTTNYAVADKDVEFDKSGTYDQYPMPCEKYQNIFKASKTKCVNTVM